MTGHVRAMRRDAVRIAGALCLAAWREQALGLAAGQAVAEPLSRFEGPADLDVVPAHEPCERGASIAEGLGVLSAGKAEPTPSLSGRCSAGYRSMRYRCYGAGIDGPRKRQCDAADYLRG